jgi:hypothetical protein
MLRFWNPGTTAVLNVSPHVSRNAVRQRTKMVLPVDWTFSFRLVAALEQVLPELQQAFRIRAARCVVGELAGKIVFDQFQIFDQIDQPVRFVNQSQGNPGTDTVLVNRGFAVAGCTKPLAEVLVESLIGREPLADGLNTRMTIHCLPPSDVDCEAICRIAVS